jgi:hypothetical protein
LPGLTRQSTLRGLETGGRDRVDARIKSGYDDKSRVR